MSYRDGTVRGDDIEDLHAMRVSSRRLRAAMDAFAATFPEKSFRRNLQQVKRITDTLGHARDLDVAIDSLSRLLPDLTAGEQVGVIALIEEYRDRRNGERRRIRRLFRDLDESGFPRRFERWIAKHTGISAKKLTFRTPRRAGD